MRGVLRSPRFLPTALALIALFVALGGPAAAAKLIGGKQIKRNAISSKHVRDGSLSEADLDPAAASSFREVAAGSVNGASVADGSLSAGDLGRFAGSVNFNFGSISGGGCVSAYSTSLTPVVADQDLRDDVIVLTPPASFIANVSFWANASAANQIGVKMCNQTGGILAINSVTFRYVTIDAG